MDIKEPCYDVVWPLGKSVSEKVRFATRISDLRGKTICELWNWAFKGEEIFPIIRESLLKRYPDISFIEYTVFGNIHGPKEEEVIAALPLEKLMFELPGPWIEGVHQCDIHALRKELLRRFGPEVNIGNVDPAELVPFEAFRRGLGVNAGGETGCSLTTDEEENG